MIARVESHQDHHSACSPMGLNTFMPRSRKARRLGVDPVLPCRYSARGLTRVDTTMPDASWAEPLPATDMLAGIAGKRSLLSGEQRLACVGAQPRIQVRKRVEPVDHDIVILDAGNGRYHLASLEAREVRHSSLISACQRRYSFSRPGLTRPGRGPRSRKPSRCPSLSRSSLSSQVIFVLSAIFDPLLSILDAFASAYDFFAAAGARCSMTLTTLPG